ncbi:MAG: UTP--glucose-1-phosphate uridylyltransferase [Ruminococcus sp.]|nr:UTP--glucose-1-phosphate uridylyltransferase [Oscillospiraceae bacterium]MDY4412880.1 UTP--glucose-1-phosphate uridylyltransferase [Ruminococcus sp.]
MNYSEALEKLNSCGQEHVLKYYGELSEESQKSLLSQIEKLDMSLLNCFSQKDISGKRGNFKPLGAVTTDEVKQRYDEFSQTGINAIKNGKVASVLLAGGQGTRLGFDHPKGMFNIGINRELYIFECLMNNIKSTVEKAGAWIPLYIMTSETNNAETVEFFEKHDYFGYNKNYVTFFIQDMAFAVDENGKIILEDKDKIFLSPNGNGGWFSSIAKAGLLGEIKNKGIEWINVFAVDNVLQQIADPAFIGSVICSECESGGKVVSKASPNEKVGVLCLENDKPSIVEYYEMTDEMINRREPDGSLSYRYGVILNYLFRTDRLEEIMNNEMPVHIVKKKVNCLDENGNPVNREVFKFETLVLDMIHMQKSCLSYEVERNREFAPVKNAEGVDSVDTARNLLIENGIEI